MNAKKYIAGFFIVTLLSSASVFIPSNVHAEEVSLSQLIELFISLGFIPAEKATQARAAVAQFNTSQSCESVNIGRDLMFGARGDDVARLQTYLAKDGNLYPGGLVTSYYGPATQQAVQRFQRKYGIVSSGSGYGVVGPRTRAELAKCHLVTNTTKIVPVAGAAGQVTNPTTSTIRAILPSTTSSGNAAGQVASPTVPITTPQLPNPIPSGNSTSSSNNNNNNNNTLPPPPPPVS